MKEIKLTRNKVAIVDDGDFEILSKMKWYAHERFGIWYALSGSSKKTVRMHRIIMNAPKGKMVDHKNGDGLDNRRCNLRIATVSENNRNARKIRKGVSIYKGVKFLKANSRWKAYINFNKKHYYLGTYDTEKQAAEAYDKAAKKYHGEFAKGNFF